MNYNRIFSFSFVGKNSTSLQLMRLKKSESQFLYLRNSAIKFENGKMKNGFSICNFPIKIGNWKLTNFYHLKWKLKFAKISFFISILNWKLNGTFDAQSVSQKGHSIFVLKWNRVLIFFFRFSFSLSNRKTSLRSQFRFSIKIEKWISVRFFTKSFLRRSTPLISHIT